VRGHRGHRRWLGSLHTREGLFTSQRWLTTIATPVPLAPPALRVFMFKTGRRSRSILLYDSFSNPVGELGNQLLQKAITRAGTPLSHARFGAHISCPTPIFLRLRCRGNSKPATSFGHSSFSAT